MLLLGIAVAQTPGVETIDIAPVWAGHPVGFCLITHGGQQFAAYYDAERRLTVASRTLDSAVWQKAVLPERVGWDSHNYVTMAIDDDGYIHLSGNLHVTPLKYFRTKTPLDVTTFERAPMVGKREQRMTYPVFMRGGNGEFIFTYRDGHSGEGDQIYNVYDHATQSWRRLMDEPLTSGEGKVNAYLNGPKQGPDGRWHLCWVWRDHGGCETNHDLSYARSDDLVHWETGAGKPLALPLTMTNADIVDPVPAGGGIINGNTKLGFDSQQRPVIGYHKFDADGNTQIYNARLEDGVWRIYQTSDWDYRWDFSGGGSIVFEISLSGVSRHGEGTLKQSYRHVKYGNGVWILDEKTLKPVGMLETKKEPDSLAVVESDFPGMQIKRANDSGTSGEAGVRYMLQWETLGHNRDRPREGKLPPPSMLRLVKRTSSS
ncbi:MAG: hypothetical protein GWP08_06885 [Nitrospiraceae bacterium]|nr:hypothetical protein [Nitrospiraceae bacterium]